MFLPQVTVSDPLGNQLHLAGAVAAGFLLVAVPMGCAWATYVLALRVIRDFRKMVSWDNRFLPSVSMALIGAIIAGGAMDYAGVGHMPTGFFAGVFFGVSMLLIGLFRAVI